MPYFCYESYCRMKEIKAKNLCKMFNKNMFNIPQDISKLISLYIADVSIEEYSFYINLFKSQSSPSSNE
jgi:hypothetical protein